MGKAKLHRAPRPFGNAHHHYRSAWNLKKIDPIIKSLLATDGISLRSLSRGTGIPFETLRRWKLKLTENPQWSPKETKWGKHRRIFTDDEEAEIAHEIRHKYIAGHQLFTSSDFEMLVIDRYLQKFMNFEHPAALRASRHDRCPTTSQSQHFRRPESSCTTTVSPSRSRQPDALPDETRGGRGHDGRLGYDHSGNSGCGLGHLRRRALDLDPEMPMATH
jgi:hypothetical protein